MTTAAQAGADARNDPVYQQAMDHLHRGRWEQAIQLFGALAGRYPQDATLVAAMDDARFKAHLDATSKVRAKQVIIPWRRIGLVLAFVATLVFLSTTGYLFLSRGIRPILAQAAERRVQAQLLSDANAYLAAGEWDLAEERFNKLLASVPDHVEAQAGLATIAEERSLRALYDRAVAAEDAGQLREALQIYSELQTRRSGYLDSRQRVARLHRWQEIDRLVDESATLTQMQLLQLATQRLEQARSLDMDYRSRDIRPALTALYIEQARQILEAKPAQLEQIPAALDLLDQALELDTRNDMAVGERRLARLYLEGRDFGSQGNWQYAVNRYQALYDERPDYLAGSIPGLLYDAYIGSGDQYRDAGDCTLAYDQYSKAMRLPVEDKTVAIARMAEVTACLTPTPTPTNTPQPTGTPLPTGTPTPTPTPVPLLNFRGRIAFQSDNPDRPGIWVMNPDGSGRQYLGTVEAYTDQVAALREAETWSPDHTLRVYVTDMDGRPQIFVDFSNHPQFKSIGNKPLTRMTGIAYDPVWSPDGGQIAYVTQENESDDIWLMNADGTNQRALMRNDWEWDKHPSWSPDSTLIVFWSNRNGLKQIYVMDTNGKVLRNLSSVGWDEYDPVWIK